MSRKFHDHSCDRLRREVGDCLGLADVQSIRLHPIADGKVEAEVAMLLTDRQADEIARIFERHFAESARPALHVSEPAK